ncbi:hypothetical protein CY35_14G020000 [Sphagnum magellanicum]|nr:hypothetical protein CY35_14G020000 [Sphagnum magellanicum]
MHSETGQKFVCSRGVSVTTTTVATPTLRRHGEAVCKQPNCSQPSNVFLAANHGDVMIGLSPRATRESAIVLSRE